MSERVLQEFATRLTRAKNLLETTKNQCGLLKREAFKLEQVIFFDHLPFPRHTKESIKKDLQRRSWKASFGSSFLNLKKR